MMTMESRLVLHRFLVQEFGYDCLTTMLDRLRDVPAGFDAGGESEYARVLYLNSNSARIDADRFADYDKKIADLSRRLRMDGEHGRGWKPHQWLALLFAEHYLRRYFEDPETLRNALNFAKQQDPTTQSMPDYTERDLRTVAVQSATGSGKTLVMHGHILQYRRLAAAAARPPNNVILVTPNESLSAQHEREFLTSNLPARLFTAEAGSDLLGPVEIIDLNKLAEQKGVKRVAVSDFGNNNLVLVDEGHLGSSGNVWRKRRAELARSGFTFEYSATFNQIVGNDESLRNTYGKCLLFDYPYRVFHAEGYGKDYSISNLRQGYEDANSRIYLLGCLLKFYWQCRIWREGHIGWADFNVTRPLWVFIGKTVTGASNAARETKSDVVRILDFLGWVLAHRGEVVPMLTHLLEGDSGLTDENDADFFAGQFDALKGESRHTLYDDICKTLFYGPGQLHVRYLTQGEGELHLSTADNDPFGIVNIGDPTALYRLLDEADHSDLVIERDTGFVKRLFADVDRPDSTVNIVIGARRFIAGWNSWRVSTMGLMHVGVGEGPEIIQMFGRGVRLKGWKMSLKRHRESAAPPPPDGDLLSKLETLHIFGLRSNYMQVFNEILQEEGVSIKKVPVSLPVTWNFARKDLKILRLNSDLKYERSPERPILGIHDNSTGPRVKLDRYSQLQVIDVNSSRSSAVITKEPRSLTRYTALFDRQHIYDRVIARKRQSGWHNLAISRQAVDQLLTRDDWYTLYLPPDQFEPKDFSELRKLEGVAIDLVVEYVGEFWKKNRMQWELNRLEVTALDKSDPNNIQEYTLSIDEREEQLIEDVRKLARNLREQKRGELDIGLLMRDEIRLLMRDQHAYKPLLHSSGEAGLAIQPVPLNASEAMVVTKLSDLASSDNPCIRGRELCLMRNLTRGRGVSFFDDHAYYPDFIVWLVDKQCQHIIFLDPKGLVHFGHKELRKVELHSRIKDIEKRVREDDPTLCLHAYVLSVTAPEGIGSDRLRSQEEWEEMGVYFMHQDPHWPERILMDVCSR